MQIPGKLRVRTVLCFSFAALLFCVESGGQTQDKASAEVSTHDSQPTFTTRANLVLLRVVVRDKNGQVNGTLQKEDFQLFDKGKPQIISKFTVEKTTARKVEPPPAQKLPDEPAPSTAALPDRYVAYVFDSLHLSFGDLAQARKAAERHLVESLPEGTRVAVYTTAGQPMLDFTDDLAKVRDTLQQIQPRGFSSRTGTDCPDLSYYQADLIQNRHDPSALRAATQDTLLCAHLDPQTMMQIAQSMAEQAASRVTSIGETDTRLTLRLLSDVVRRLSAMPGQRNMVVVSPGFLVIDQRSDESDLMDRAIRSNVTINTLDARGLYALVPGGDASQPNINSSTVLARTQFARESANAEGDVLAELADGTGGTWIHNSNDLDDGFKRIAAAPEYYYVLGFSSPNLKFDGSYHNLKVSLKNPAGLTLQARRGYVAPKHEVNAAQEAKRELEEALFSRDEWHDIPVALNTQFFKSSDVNAKLSVLARIDVRQLRFRKADGRNLDVLTVVSGLFDRNGSYVAAVEKTVDMHLKDETLAGNKLGAGITVRSGFDVTPGSYFVRIVVRDAEGQKMAALNGAVEIP